MVLHKDWIKPWPDRIFFLQRPQDSKKVSSNAASIRFLSTQECKENRTRFYFARLFFLFWRVFFFFHAMGRLDPLCYPFSSTRAHGSPSLPPTHSPFSVCFSIDVFLNLSRYYQRLHSFFLLVRYNCFILAHN